MTPYMELIYKIDGPQKPSFLFYRRNCPNFVFALREITQISFLARNYHDFVFGKQEGTKLTRFRFSNISYRARGEVSNLRLPRAPKDYSRNCHDFILRSRSFLYIHMRTFSRVQLFICWA